MTRRTQHALIRVCISHGHIAKTKRSRSRSTGSRNARPLRECDCQKEKGSDIDASPQLPISVGVQSLDRSIEVTMVGTTRSIEITKVSYQVQSSDEAVRCATISRQLHVGQGIDQPINNIFTPVL